MFRYSFFVGIIVDLENSSPSDRNKQLWPNWHVETVSWASIVTFYVSFQGIMVRSRKQNMILDSIRIKQIEYALFVTMQRQVSLKSILD